MRLLRCDVAVIGAGPSGCMAARFAAKQGVNVLLLEEHRRVGQPVYCAEGLSHNGLKDAGLEPTSEIVSQKISKVRVYSPNKKSIELKSSDWVGYTINRDVFDYLLSEKAREAGAELLTGARAKEVIKQNGVVQGVIANKEGLDFKIDAKVVIGADGYASTIRRSSGMGRWYPDVVTCAQFRLGGLKLEEPNVNEFYVGSKVAPGAYAWIFPKSKEVANVGLGVRKIQKEPPLTYLKRFINFDERFKEAKILLVNGGITPVSGMIDRLVGDGVMLVGDAAGQLIPMTGAGVHSGVMAGKIAGEVAASACKEDNITASRLGEYVNRFDLFWGRRIRDSRRVVEMIDKFSDDDLDTLAETLTSEDVTSLANGIDVPRVLARIVSRAPLKIIKLMAAFMRA
jgi:digeranylgeranylglycerophospholipid reductase